MLPLSRDNIPSNSAQVVRVSTQTRNLAITVHGCAARHAWFPGFGPRKNGAACTGSRVVPVSVNNALLCARCDVMMFAEYGYLTIQLKAAADGLRVFQCLHLKLVILEAVLHRGEWEVVLR